jgi:hypothetical protein
MQRLREYPEKENAGIYRFTNPNTNQNKKKIRHHCHSMNEINSPKSKVFFLLEISSLKVDQIEKNKAIDKDYFRLSTYISLVMIVHEISSKNQFR